MTSRRRRLFATSILAFLAAATAAAGAAPGKADVDIPAGALQAALTSLERQTHLEILYDPRTVAGRAAPAVKGRLSPDEALRLLTRGSDIDVVWSGPNAVSLRAHGAAAIAHTSGPLQTAPVSDPPFAPGMADTPPSAMTTGAAAAPAGPTDAVLVVGTHIRGLKANASPAVELTRDDLVRLGDATLADALQRLPQNFAGTANPLTVQLGVDPTGTNTMAAQGVNLRGLGANATLVLLDGHRIAGSGIQANVPDISSIPTAAVDRVEVLLDGASAIYGSDAVGGVVNIITRRDFNGAETLVHEGQAEGGVAPTFQFAQTVGGSWDGGHLMMSYQYQRQGDLPNAARRVTANADLTAQGGSNWDTLYGGNILALNTAHTAYISAYAIPSGSGLGLTPSSFVAGAANYNNYRLGADVIPNQDSQGVFLAASQHLDPKTEVTFDGRFNQRSFTALNSAGSTVLTVTSKNPFFVSPNGATSELIGYSALDTVGPYQQSGRDTSYDGILTVARDLFGTWRLSADVDLAGEHGVRTTTHELNSAHLSEALGTTTDNPATAFNTAADGFFNPYGTANSKAVIDFIGDGYYHEVDDDQVLTVDLQADGDLCSLPGGVVKAAFGGQFRHERAEFNSVSVTTASPFLSGGVPYGRDVSAAYGELNIPIVGDTNRLPGVHRLTLSLAGRFEHYDDAGSSTNPKVGLIWVPAADVTLHASYGTSFRAPSLYQMHFNPVVSVSSVPNSVGGTTLSLIEYGGNSSLRPETATSWTAGVEWTPHQLPGLSVGASWFYVDYTNRIDDPGASALATILINPTYAALVQRLDSSNAADLAAVKALVARSASASASLYPATAYGAIINAGYLNVAALLVQGVDLSARYKLTVGEDRFAVTGSATYLADYKQQTTPNAGWAELVSTAGEPVDWRARVTFDWMRGAYDTAFTVNYVDRYWDPLSKRSIDAWTTADLTLAWRSPAASGPLKGLVASAAIQNLFDTAPPFYNNLGGIGFDPANANPLGRTWSVQLSKHW